MQGLAHRERSDARHSTLSDRMEGIITYVRLTNKDATYRFIREKAGERARKIGESEPSDWQIRYVLDRIPKAVLALADGRENKFRNGSRITFLLTYDGSEIVIQVDWTLVDVLVKDLRQPGVRSPSGETRLYLLRAKECSSRGSPAARFLYDRPNKFDVAALIRDVLIRSERNPFGGKFNRLDVDNGPELISDMVQFICAELHIDMPRDSPRHPEGRARAERDFGMLNTRLWSTLLGYVNSNTTARNPSAKAVLTPMELEDKYWEFMAIYHNEPQEELGGKTPIEFYHEHCFAEPVDPRLLDTLLLEPVDRVVRKEGIQLDNRIYWHENLGDIVNQPVLVRAAPAYKAPDEIEVFYDGTWFCTAVAIDSPKGRAIPREQIAAAQHTQRRRIKGRIAHARASLVAIDREIEFGEVAHAENVEEGPSPASSAKPVTIDPSSGMNMVTMPKDLASKPAKDWLDRMNDHTIS